MGKVGGGRGGEGRWSGEGGRRVRGPAHIEARETEDIKNAGDLLRHRESDGGNVLSWFPTLIGEVPGK